jgi:thiol-disulfide isomerase/thioredoxin
MTSRIAFSTRTRISLFTLGLIGAAIIGFALYGKGGGAGNVAAGECAGSEALATKIAPLAKGAVAALKVETRPRLLPDFAFAGPNGPLSPKDFRGRPYLFNLWATWCVPCRAEMPALDALQAKAGGDGFQVLALNMDTRNVEKVPQWLKDNGVGHLTLYQDSDGKAFQTLRREGLVTGLPTTILVDQKGCMVAEMAGPAEWDGPEAVALIAALKGD